MIFLAFLLPFSIYLLVLGTINRRQHPVLVPGGWDFAGILFAASGFLLAIGPAVISSGSETWRMFWMFGARAGIPAVDESTTRVWSILAGLYFFVVVGGAAFLLRQRRSQTAIYNVTPDIFEKALSQVFGSLGLNPLRSGSLFVFGTFRPFAGSSRSGLSAEESHFSGEPLTATVSREAPALTAVAPTTESAVLEVDPFALLRHVTLRWEPATSRLREEIEGELAKTLAQTPSSPNPAGDWMVLVAFALIGFNLLMTFGLALANFLRR